MADMTTALEVICVVCICLLTIGLIVGITRMKKGLGYFIKLKYPAIAKAEKKYNFKAVDTTTTEAAVFDSNGVKLTEWKEETASTYY